MQSLPNPSNVLIIAIGTVVVSLVLAVIASLGPIRKDDDESH
jgi:ABC-type spermidine/putrescine transport system permease subunit II